QWPELIDYLWRTQAAAERPWAIVQKQTGADRLSIGGALSANIHGRGLTFKPIIQDVEAFTLVDASGDVHTCSRRDNPELFRLAVGGYGLFGLIGSVPLRLAPGAGRSTYRPPTRSARSPSPPGITSRRPVSATGRTRTS